MFSRHDFVCRCNERNRTGKNFCCHGTFVLHTMLNSVNIKIIFFIRFLSTYEIYLQVTKSMPVVTPKIFKFLSFCPENIVFKRKHE